MSKIIVGTGKYRYELIWPFGKESEKNKIGAVSHITVDSKDNIYYCQRINPPIAIFNNEGIPVNRWGEKFLVDIHGVYITENDSIFIIARGAHELLKFNTKGKLLLRIGEREKPSWQKPFNHPTDVAISRNGEIYVSDGYGNACVHKFSPNGEHLLTWGKPGSGPGEFHTPHGIWVDEHDKIYVVDRDNNRVQIFNSDGKYLNEWNDFFHPMDIFFDADNMVYVTDQTPRFTVFNTQGKIIARGFTPDFGHGIWGDSSGNLYLAGLERGVTQLLKL
jgi:peptidylglycine monooxygenase